MSKKVYGLASGNHEMYIRRRRPDTLEVRPKPLYHYVFIQFIFCRKHIFMKPLLRS